MGRRVGLTVFVLAVLLNVRATAQELPEFAKSFWPESGTPSTGEVRDGYIVWNGKPFFRNLHHGWSLWSAKRPDVFKTYRYYLLCNVASLGAESKAGAMAFWRQDIDKGVRDAIVNHRFREATRLYGMKVLCSHYLNGMQYEVPKELEGLGGEELFEKHNALMRDAATRFARVWKHHPDVGGYEIAEEYWLPGYHAADFWPPKSHYVAWLRKKYGTVEKMNAERGEKLKDFDDVPYAKGRISGSGGANNLDLADFLLEDNVRRLRAMYDALKAEHPQMLVAAAKGEFGRAEWHYAPCCDLFGWYCAVPRGYGVSNVLPRTAAEHFGKAPEFIHVDYCRYGRRGEAWPAGEPHRDDLRGIGYPHTVTEVFEGMKQQWLEDYNNSYFHYFHPTRFYREKGAVTTTWSGQKLFVHPEGVNGPDVIAPRSTLGMSRAFAWCQRSAPVFLPTHVEKGNVAVLMTGRSFALGYSHGTSKSRWRDTAQALRRLHVSYGIVRDENLADLKDYEVLIAGLPAGAVPTEVLDAVRAWVAKGGRLILMPGAFEKDAWQKPTDAVRAQMEKAAVATLDDLPAYNAEAGESSDWPTCLAMYDAALRKARATSPASLEAPGGIAATSDLTLNILKGDDYRLAGIASFDREDRTVTLRLGTLPTGNYEVVDVTGERPLVVPDAQAGYALSDDPANRYAKVLSASVSAADLKDRGIAGITVQSGMARMLLIRQAALPVIVSCPDYEVRTIALRNVGVDIVASPELGRAIVSATVNLATALRDRGVDVRVISPEGVKTENTAYEAYLHPQGVDWEHKINTFRNAPVVTTRNLIVIGSEETNKLMKHLGAPGTFTYDKVFEKITRTYPGAGRGLIGVVESVNDPSFDPTDQTRDALIVGGSDGNATLRAIRRLITLINAPNR